VAGGMDKLVCPCRVIKLILMQRTTGITKIGAKQQMIKRYTRSIMGDIWSDENKYNTWLKVSL
jgi:hypothetical protein